MMGLTLASAAIERLLNHLLWKESGLKAGRQRLYGRILTLKIREFSHPLVLVFSEQQIDVINQHEADSDCVVSLGLGELREINKRQNVTGLLKAGRLDVQGDLQVIQQFSALLDLAEWDITEYLARLIGDVPAQQLAVSGKRLIHSVKTSLQQGQRRLSEVLTEEWRATPAHLEVIWFCEETEALARQVDLLEKRLTEKEVL